ncbi:hypothetical protein [Sphingobacterium detergens]|uniref:Uncharacterized protein n=1 Tax=Sphingobacterium detergens TaxID=1145106 RepID=A0A420BI08_SPHD1|nr:hypothetical protein [Sphingobacterium detergens]RKE56307.1 hypothetical protein DFQ12_1164 [Sphingobacterium detergens]
MNNFFINELQRRGRIIIGIMLSIIIILPIIFFIGTMMETESYGRTLLGEDRYNARVNDSYLYTFGLFGCLLLLVIPGILFIKKYIDNYRQFIITLSEKDMEKLVKNNDKAPFYEKFMPPYIVKEDAVRFFTNLQQTTIAFKNITNIHVSQTHYRGYSATVKIQTAQETYRFRLSGNVLKVLNLVDEALQSNPQITVNKNWNVV